MIKRLYFLSMLLMATLSYSQVVINELDSDTPSTDDLEFIELKSDVPNFPLDGYVIVLYNGSDASSTGNKSYYAIDLDGYRTDVNGLILIGNAAVSPVPEKIFPSSIIQNGADGVAIYIGSDTDFPDQTPATSTNLVDALIHDTSDPDATELMALLGVITQINEDENGLGTTQSIQRKNDGNYEVKAPTPGANNDGTGIVFNGIAIGLNATTYNEGDSFPITFTTQTPVLSDLAFSFSLNSGSFNTADYSGNLNVTIPAGSTSFVTTITLTDDSNDDGDELAKVKFGNLPSGYNRLNDNVEIRVIDNDFTMAPWGTPLAPTYNLVQSSAPEGYYSSLEGKSGATLRQAIQDIIADPNIVRAHNYGDITTILESADKNPLNSNEVWLMYVEQGRAIYKFQTTASNVGSWNREHIFPQSRGGFANGTSSTPDGINVFLPTNADDILAGHADAHHLRAEDGPENTLRSNRDYGSDYNGPAGSIGSWHGDVARSLFYMAVRYNALSLVDGNPDDVSMNQIMGDLSTLLVWNQVDRSDDFEMNRNNVIYNWQVNRNPFIDFPDLANFIWGARAGETWFSSLSTVQNDDLKVMLYPNPMRDNINITGISGNGTIDIYSISGAKITTIPFYGDTQLSLSLEAGLYFAKFTSEGKSVVQKIIIK